jgi:hypothetical protein
MARAKAFNKENVTNFFNLLEEALKKYPVSADKIFNLDETGVTTVQRPNKILAEKGKKQVGMIASAERGSLVTVCNVVSASGQALPPAFVFPRVNFKDHMLKGAPVGSLGVAAQSGWMSSDLFPQVLDHFIKHMNVSLENRALLLMDNHPSHISLQVHQMARRHGLTIVTFPPHCSHRLQPLDISVYGPFKKFYNRAANNYMTSNVGKCITIYEVAELTAYAFNKSMSIDNITSGFRAAGIYPFNPEIFSEDQFMPSETLIGGQPGTSSSTSDVAVFTLPRSTATIKQRRGRMPAQAQVLTATPEQKHDIMPPRDKELDEPEPKKALFRKRARRCEVEDDDSESDNEPVPLEDDSDESGDMIDEEEQLGDLQVEQEITVGQYVLVRFDGKKRSVCFVGQVLQLDEFEIQVEFYRKTEFASFKKPVRDDVKFVERQQVIQVLPNPSYIGKTARTRGCIRFECNFSTTYEVN